MAAVKDYTQELISVLHNTNEEERRAVYLGIGYAIAQMEFITSSINSKSIDYKLKITTIVNTVNELAVIDYDVLKHIILIMTDCKLTCIVDNRPNLINAKDVGEVFIVHRYLSEKDLDIINDNLTLFKVAVSAFSKWYAYRFDDED